jgi:hypothetical protein
VYPWIWWWAPQFHLPFSGDVAQRIQPNTFWFFGQIHPEAGDGAMEKRIHEDVASYGRQLGLITEVLLGLTGQDTVTAEQAREALQRLKAIHAEVEQVKAHEQLRLANRIPA